MRSSAHRNREKIGWKSRKSHQVANRHVIGPFAVRLTLTSTRDPRISNSPVRPSQKQTGAKATVRVALGHGWCPHWRRARVRAGFVRDDVARDCDRCDDRTGPVALSRASAARQGERVASRREGRPLGSDEPAPGNEPTASAGRLPSASVARGGAEVQPLGRPRRRPRRRGRAGSHRSAGRILLGRRAGQPQDLSLIHISEPTRPY